MPPYATRTVTLRESPVAPGRPAEIHVREAGSGPPVVILHSGWGYEAYPFDDAIAALAPAHRVLAPDRVGYGRSGRVEALPPGFHRLMAEETFAVLDALGIREAALWGHSDGAVIAAHMAFLAPGRVTAVVLESLHFFALKRASVEFFETAVRDPEKFGPAAVEACRRDHGDGWKEVLGAGGWAWLDIVDEGRRGKHDVYSGRLAEVAAPVLVLHGARDPRTEPGELDAAMAALPGARLALLDAGHCPHTSREAARAIEAAVRFLSGEGWNAGG
ncbi:MAG TPA: alpha/beta hydrolase [Anaeromyxobacter sp.]